MLHSCGIWFKRGWFALLQYKHFHAETGKVWHVKCNLFLTRYKYVFRTSYRAQEKLCTKLQRKYNAKWYFVSKLLFLCT